MCVTLGLVPSLKWEKDRLTEIKVRLEMGLRWKTVCQTFTRP